jgi:zinc D-Ala-D-Ala dipeptidase
LRSVLLIVLSFLLVSCEPQGIPVFQKNVPPLANETIRKVISSDSSELERMFVLNGLLNIHEFDTNIRVLLFYNTDRNFLGRNLYQGLNKCYLPCEVAIKLGNAQKFLKEEFPLYNLIVFDATRPHHIQKMMWDSLKMETKEKYSYVARPEEFSLHNYGAAVDVGIIGENHLLLDMGTPFDYFGELAQPKLEEQNLANGSLDSIAHRNRLLLRRVMMRAGFNPIPSEWWHFNACTKVYASANLKLIE